MFMQTMPPLFYVPVQMAESAPQVVAVKALSDATASGSQGETGHPDAQGADPASVRAGKIARSDPEGAGQRIEPLDTRVVGDGDKIDPDRPTVRGPEPAVELLLPEDGRSPAEGAVNPDRQNETGRITDTPRSGWDFAGGAREPAGPDGTVYAAEADPPRSVDIRR